MYELSLFTGDMLETEVRLDLLDLLDQMLGLLGQNRCRLMC